jgi:hypothetical protein
VRSFLERSFAVLAFLRDLVVCIRAGVIDTPVLGQTRETRKECIWPVESHRDFLYKAENRKSVEAWTNKAVETYQE